MDANAYLLSQGWRGDGHALHHSGRGISKPIAVSKKSNVFGIGKKQHDAHADQWWARAFDDTLKALNTTKDDSSGDTKSVSLGAGAQALQMVRKGGDRWVGQHGLYSNFVRGQGLGGTLEPEDIKPTSQDPSREDIGNTEEELLQPSPQAMSPKKRKRKHRDTPAENFVIGAAHSSGERSDSKSKPSHAQTLHEPTGEEGESKEERRRRRKERRYMKALKKSNISGDSQQESIKTLGHDVSEASQRPKRMKKRKSRNNESTVLERKVDMLGSTSKSAKQKARSTFSTPDV